MIPYNPFSLKNKKILVTGASSGIGRAIAIACSMMGGDVILTARNKSRLGETLSLMQATDNKIIIADLKSSSDISRLVEELPDLDGIVHSAGIGSRVLCKNILKTDYDNIFENNFEAPVKLQTELLHKKKINKEASIIFIASKAASFPSVGNALYSASKGAIISYAKCLGLELAPQRIRVNCICPSMVWTNLIIQDGIAKEDLEEAEKKYPLKRYGKPEDIAYLAIYLLSDASKWMTGSDIDITGGAKEL